MNSASPTHAGSGKPEGKDMVPFGETPSAEGNLPGLSCLKRREGDCMSWELLLGHTVHSALTLAGGLFSSLLFPALLCSCCAYLTELSSQPQFSYLQNGRIIVCVYVCVESHK